MSTATTSAFTRNARPGFSYVGASVLRGRLSGEQLEAAAELAERFGSGSLRATTSQNLVFVDIPNHRAIELAAELGKIGLQVEGSSFWRGAVACTGTEFCKLAITETKGFTRWLVDELEERLPEFDQQLKLHVTGCPTAAASTGSPTSASKARRSSTTANSPTPTTSASAARSANMPPSLARSVIVALRRWFQKPSNACCAVPRDREPEENLRAWFSRYSNDELRCLVSRRDARASRARCARTAAFPRSCRLMACCPSS